MYEVNNMWNTEDFFTKMSFTFLDSLFVILGLVFIGLSIGTEGTALPTIGGLLTTAGALGVLHSFATTEIAGDYSLVEKLATKSFYESKHCEMALESIQKQLSERVEEYAPVHDNGMEN